MGESSGITHLRLGYGAQNHQKYKSFTTVERHPNNPDLSNIRNLNGIHIGFRYVSEYPESISDSDIYRNRIGIFSKNIKNVN